MATAIMKQKEVPEMDDVEEIISKISEDSPYKRRPTQKRTWMTVPEMGKLLGTTRSSVYAMVISRHSPIISWSKQTANFQSFTELDRE